MKKVILLFIIFCLVGCNNKKNTYNKVEEKLEVKEEIVEKELTIEDYQNNKVDELGEVPIMMYHGIQNKKNSDTSYIGGNIDKDGYQRTSEAFINDLEFYYNNGYRMIRLTDYIDGDINVELGKSPIILTFDDGLSNNMKVNGVDEEGNLIIDPNCAVGILESFKEKYPDYNVTATFFVNGGLFNQGEYNEKILKWLIENGYDIGNHTYSHVDFTKIGLLETQKEVGQLYELLENIIPSKYVNIVALPFGSPYSITHENMDYIFNSTYNSKTYETKATLRVGWKAEISPYHTNFNPKFLKRIRAYDNNGVEFDIQMNFKLLEETRYISDGDIEKIVIPEERSTLIKELYSKELISY